MASIVVVAIMNVGQPANKKLAHSSCFVVALLHNKRTTFFILSLGWKKEI